tara:strand:+ start:68 stop:454 length:387 start_codon:yes stop_codon:yes gene_type:complete
MKPIKKENIIYLTLLLLITIYFNFFENIYVIYRSNISERLTKDYGYCERSSYGFVKYVDKKYKLKNNITIINDEEYPSSDAFIYKPKKNYNNKFLILLNYNELNSKIDMSQYIILEKFKNCFYLKKND